MNYRRIELNDKNDKELESILFQIGKWHNLTPKQWRPDYRVTSEDIEKTVERIRKTKNEDLFLAVAEDEQEQIQGFIWAYKQEKPKDSVMIISLYVTENYRRKGIATNLKLLLEDWCRFEGIKTIQTTVHYNNRKMIELNEKLGYTPGMVNMTKSL
jgi:RimJ/RimL family protein N-acetyltransferase